MNYLESSFEVMQLPDLFQWIGGASKTGVCTFSSRSGTRKVFFKDGRIIGCTATDPHLLLGQFLISNGRLQEDMLKTLLQIQEHTGRTLGSLILEERLLSEQELLRLVAAKAEETIYGLFDLTEAAFRFDPDRAPAENSMEVSLDVNSVLLDAAVRKDELVRARAALPSMNVVLQRTELAPDPASLASFMGNKLYESINGVRTLAEIILMCRTSEYLACSFLLNFLEHGLIQLGGVRQAAATNGTESDPAAKVRELVAEDRFGEALELAEAANLQAGHNQYMSMLLARAESGFIADTYRTRITPDAVPKAVQEAVDPALHPNLSADELFVLDLADGKWNIRSLAWIAPLRKADLLRSMVKLLDAGLIRLLSEEELRETLEPDDEMLLNLPIDSDDLSELDRIL
jgi:hypothetical protein